MFRDAIEMALLKADDKSLVVVPPKAAWEKQRKPDKRKVLDEEVFVSVSIPVISSPSSNLERAMHPITKMI